MTDPGERLRSSLAADQSSAGSPTAWRTSTARSRWRRCGRPACCTRRTRSPSRSPSRIRVITIANQKGGVGKTTSTVNLGVALALYGLRTLVIDLDPQGNASTALGVEHTVGTPSVYDALVGDSSLAEVVHPTTAPEAALRAGDDRPRRRRDRAGLRRRPRAPAAPGHRGHVHALPPEQRPHYVLIDCPPSLGLLTLNALVAGDEVLIPIQCEYYALEGLGQLLNNIDLVRQHLNPGIAVRTILLTMYDGRTKLADQVADEVRNHFGDVVLQAVIPRNVRVSEAPGLRPVGAHLRPRLARLDQLRRGGPPARRARGRPAADRRGRQSRDNHRSPCRRPVRERCPDLTVNEERR